MVNPSVETKKRISDSLKEYYSIQEHKDNLLKNLNKATKSRNSKTFKKQGETLSKNIRLGIVKSSKGRRLSEEHKQKVSQANKGKILSEDTKRKISEGVKNHLPSTSFKEGFHQKEETKNKISDGLKIAYQQGRKKNYMTGRHLSEETKKKISLGNLGKRKVSLEGKRHLSEIMREGGSIRARSFQNQKPNKPEKILIEIIKSNNLPFNYVGDGSIYFKGKNHSFNPDFLSKNPKHIIEVFGDYWHNLHKHSLKDKERLETYSKYGYKTLIIWEHELNPRWKTNLTREQLVNKIKEFIQ